MFIEAPDRFNLVTPFNPALGHMHTLVALFREYAPNFTEVYIMLHDVRGATEVLRVFG